MRYLIVILILAIPIISFAQKKQFRWNRSAGQQINQSEAFKSTRIFKNNFDAGSFHLQRAGAFLLGGTVAELIGGGVIIAGSNNGDAAIVAGGIMAGAGLILQIVGYSQLLKSGQFFRKVSISKNGLSYNF